MYQIVQSPNAILRQPVSERVTSATPKLAKVIASMSQTLVAQKDPEGVGLAANQVGLPYKLFLARFDIKKNSPIHIFINPEIVAHSDETQPDPDDQKPTLEGCLSLPRYYGMVKRWKSVILKYQTLNSADQLEEKEESFHDFPAMVIQHEMDHLTGHIFVERILEQKGKLYKITGKTKRGRDEWEEVEI